MRVVVKALVAAAAAAFAAAAATVTRAVPLGGCGGFVAPVVDDPTAALPANSATDYGGAILLTNGGHQRGDVWWNGTNTTNATVPVDRPFTARVTFSIRSSSEPPNAGPADGVLVLLQNDPKRALALGQPGDLVDPATPPPMAPVWSLYIDTHDLPTNRGGVYTVGMHALWANGTEVGADAANAWRVRLPPAGPDLGNGAPWVLSMAYSTAPPGGPAFNVSLAPVGSPLVAWSTVFNFTLDATGTAGLVALFGGNVTTAVLGLQGATGAAYSTQVIEGFTYAYVADPASPVSMADGNNVTLGVGCALPYNPPPVPLSLTWIITIAVGAGVGALALLLCVWCCCCCHHGGDEYEEEDFYGYEDPETGEIVILGAIGAPRKTTLSATRPVLAAQVAGAARSSMGALIGARPDAPLTSTAPGSGSGTGGAAPEWWRTIGAAPSSTASAASASDAPPASPAVAAALVQLGSSRQLFTNPLAASSKAGAAAAANADDDDEESGVGKLPPPPEGKRPVLLRQLSKTKRTSFGPLRVTAAASSREGGGGAPIVGLVIEDAGGLVATADEAAAAASGTGRALVTVTALPAPSHDGAEGHELAAAVHAAAAKAGAPANARLVTVMRRTATTGGGGGKAAERAPSRKGAPADVSFDGNYRFEYIGGTRVARRVASQKPAAGGGAGGFSFAGGAAASGRGPAAAEGDDATFEVASPMRR
jgi:hypothetical protein